MNYATDREIHVVGVQRTGQHAITSWLIGHFDSVVYKNCMSQLGRKKGKMVGFEIPFWAFTKDELGYKELTHYDEVGNSKPSAIILGTEFTVFDIGLNPEIREQKHYFCQQYGLDEFSKRRDNVLVIRDPYNQYASVLNWGRNRLLSNPNSFSKMWIKMAKECLNKTQNFEHKVVLKYDEWFSDPQYRRLLETILDLKEDDSRLNTVMKIGHGRSWGSSFDGMKKKKDAQSMNVLKRWETVKDDNRFVKLTQNDELKELSEELGWECPL